MFHDVRVQVPSLAPYRVFIRDLTYGHSIFVFLYNLMYGEGRPSLFCLCRLCDIFHRYALACIRNMGLFCGVRQFDISDKTVIYNYSLRSTFACTSVSKISIWSISSRSSGDVRLSICINLRIADMNFSYSELLFFNSSILCRVSAILAFKSIRSFSYL